VYKNISHNNTRTSAYVAVVMAYPLR